MYTPYVYIKASYSNQRLLVINMNYLNSRLSYVYNKHKSVFSEKENIAIILYIHIYFIIEPNSFVLEWKAILGNNRKIRNKTNRKLGLAIILY